MINYFIEEKVIEECYNLSLTDNFINPEMSTGFDANSIMLSCFVSGEDGEFGHYDEVALEYLY